MMTDAAQISTRGDLAGRQVLVVGLARSGIAVARFAVDAGARVTVYDRRTAAELADAVTALADRPLRLALGVAPDAATALVNSAQLIVTSPSISTSFPTTEPWLREALRAAESRGIPVVSEVDLFLRLTRARVLGVTGTKGKTTTTALLGAMLTAGGLPHEVGGNIGRPLVELADALGPADWAVLELSELQLPTISRGADLSVYTNILADHLDRHGSLEAYRAAKMRLAELARGPVVLNIDDPVSRELGARLASGTARWYGLAEGEASVRNGTLLLAGATLLPVDAVPLPGAHMLRNVLAAALGAHLAGVPHAAIADAVRSFPGVPHRLETLGSIGGVRYVNDSQATIPLATLAALDAFGTAPVVLIAGGRGKGLDYRQLAEAIVRSCRTAVLIGETAPELERLIAGRIPVARAAAMPDAVATARAATLPGDVVLLSPAAASFDMFRDYAARGDAFRAAVARLAAKAGVEA